jgi:hypothetical protein
LSQKKKRSAVVTDAINNSGFGSFGWPILGMEGGGRDRNMKSESDKKESQNSQGAGLIKKEEEKRCVERDKRGVWKSRRGEVGWVIGQSDNRDAKNQNNLPKIVEFKLKINGLLLCCS